MVDLGELVLMRAGQLVRQLDLVVRQNGDDEMRTLLEGGKALRIERALHNTSGGEGRTRRLGPE
jgi:hypothetical protein